MRIRRLMSIVLVVAALSLLAVQPLSSVRADGVANFVSAGSTCQEGVFSFQLNLRSVPSSSALALPPFAEVTAEDSEGTLLGAQDFVYVGSLLPYEGMITYSQRPVGDVTFKLWLLSGQGVSSLNRVQIDGFKVLEDEVTVPAQCAAGCDLLVAIPSTAVMGMFVTDALLYYVPGQLIVPNLTVGAGKTYLVIGQDATGEFREIMLGCTFVWVPFNSVGPDPEPLWNNKPLPTTVVE